MQNTATTVPDSPRSANSNNAATEIPDFYEKLVHASLRFSVTPQDLWNVVSVDSTRSPLELYVYRMTDEELLGMKRLFAFADELRARKAEPYMIRTTLGLGRLMQTNPSQINLMIRYLPWVGH